MRPLARAEGEPQSRGRTIEKVSLRRFGSEWAHLGSNQGPLACEASALPLSYAPGRGCKRSSGAAARSVNRLVTERLPLRNRVGQYRGSDQAKGRTHGRDRTTSPHHQLLHLVEAAQQAGYSETEIVEIVERELETDADVDRGRLVPAAAPAARGEDERQRREECRAGCVCVGCAACQEYAGSPPPVCRALQSPDGQHCDLLLPRLKRVRRARRESRGGVERPRARRRDGRGGEEPVRRGRRRRDRLVEAAESAASPSLRICCRS